MKNWRTYLNGATTVALSGGATAASAIYMDPTHFNTKDLSSVAVVFLGGALIALLHWLRDSPREANYRAARARTNTGPTSGPVLALLLGVSLAASACASSSGAIQTGPAGQRLALAKVTHDVVDAAEAANRLGELSDANTAVILNACDDVLQVLDVDRLTYGDAIARILRVARDSLSDTSAANADALLTRIRSVAMEALP